MKVDTENEYSLGFQPTLGDVGFKITSSEGIVSADSECIKLDHHLRNVGGIYKH